MKLRGSTCIGAWVDVQAIIDIHRIFIDISYQDCGYYTCIINASHRLYTAIINTIFHTSFNQKLWLSSKSLPHSFALAMASRVGRWVKIFQQATVSLPSSECRNFHTGVCQHMQCVVTAIYSLHRVSNHVTIQRFFSLTRQVLHASTEECAALNGGICHLKIRIWNAACCFTTVFGLTSLFAHNHHL